MSGALRQQVLADLAELNARMAKGENPEILKTELAHVGLQIKNLDAASQQYVIDAFMSWVNLAATIALGVAIRKL